MNNGINPHITLVHAERDAKGVGTFIPINTIELDILLETQVSVTVNNNTNVIIYIDELIII